MEGNKFMVGSVLKKNDRLISIPIAPGTITKEEAIEFAAWIIVLADPTRSEFEKILREIRNT